MRTTVGGLVNCTGSNHIVFSYLVHEQRRSDVHADDFDGESDDQTQHEGVR